MSTPSQELAQKIMNRLVAEKVMTAEDAKNLCRKLAEGELKVADWRLALEKALARELKP